MGGRAGPSARRTFAAPSLAATAEAYNDYVQKSVKSYEADKAAVNASMEAELSGNKVCLFMDGTPESPKSLLSLNIVKMLTEAQVVPLVSIDVSAHPAILGYTVSKSQNMRAPHLYVNGSYYGDHDSLLQKYASGELKRALGDSSTLSTGVFKGELPIASY